jgi:hypothetical protein
MVNDAQATFLSKNLEVNTIFRFSRVLFAAVDHLINTTKQNTLTVLIVPVGIED